jgi:hypothetical protein
MTAKPSNQRLVYHSSVNFVSNESVFYIVLPTDGDAMGAFERMKEIRL